MLTRRDFLAASSAAFATQLFGEPKSSKTPDAALAEKVQDRMLEAGFLIGLGGFYGNVLRIQPPLIISDEDLDRACAALDGALGV